MVNGSLNKKNAEAKSLEREAWAKIVIKIISWKDGIPLVNHNIHTDKITPKEWKTYCEGRIKNNQTYDKAHIQQQLDEIKEKIQENNGFE